MSFFSSLSSTPFKPSESPPYNNRQFSEVIDVQFNATGSKLLFSKLDRSLHVLHRSYDHTENTISIAQLHEKPIEQILFHPVREYQFCTVLNDNKVKIWQCSHDAGDYHLVKEVLFPPQLKNFLCYYSPTGDVLLVVTKSNTCYFLLPNEDYRCAIEFQESSNIYDFCWSNDGTLFFLGLDGGMATLNEFKSYVPVDSPVNLYSVQRIHAISSGISSSIIKQIKMDPRGSYFVTLSNLGVVQIFSTRDFTCSRTILAVDELVTGLDVSRDGTYIVVCFEQLNSLRIYDIYDGSELFVVENCKSGKKANCVLRFNPAKLGLVYAGFRDGGVVFMTKSVGNGSVKSDGAVSGVGHLKSKKRSVRM